MVADELRGVVAQRVLTRADGAGQIRAFEVMMSNSGIREAIGLGNFETIPELIRAGAHEGMHEIDDEVMKLRERNAISRKEAYMKALDKNRFLPLDIP